MLGWVFLFLVLILIEAFIADFTALTISIGALAGITAALLHLPFSLQIVSFSIVTFASLILLKPFLQKKLIPLEQHFTADSYIGHNALVIEKITCDQKGRIKIGGETWFAESTVTIEEGETVIISEIDSAIMKVVPASDILDTKSLKEQPLKTEILKKEPEKEEI